MRKLLCFLFYLLLTVLPIQLKADDASAVAYEHWSYGHVKASTPNKQIALEKELMIVTEKSIQAIFIFRNTTNQYVETPCVFPITSDIRCDEKTEEGDSVFFMAYQGASNHLLWAIALDERVHNPTTAPVNFSTTKAAIKAADKRLRKYTYRDYLKRVKELTDTTYLTGCSIQQNGQNVPIMNVGIETTTNAGLHMDIYFYHFLKFKPNEVSKVVVEYPIESFEIEYDGCRSYKMVYDISSGGTWKNRIKSFMIYSTMSMESSSKNPENQKFGSCIFSDWKIYYKKDYKPIADDRFIFRSADCTSFMGEASESLLKDRMDYYLESDSIVKIINGRDELNPYAAFPKKSDPSPYVVNVSSSTGKDVSSLFDGNLYTSYVTPKSSYVEFSLKEPVLGPFVSNGFVSNTFNEKVFCQNMDPREDYAFPMFKDSIWENTSRIKKIALQRIGAAETDTFLLADKYGVLPCIRDDWKSVNAVHHPKILLPGKYRLSFIETYRGKKYSDAGVSEIWFYPYPEDLIAMVDEEQKDSLRIFQDYYKNTAPDWVIKYDFVPYDLLRSQEGSYYKECLKKYEDDSLRMQLDSLANYCAELRTNDSESDTDTTATQDSGDGSSGSTVANSSYRYIILGAILLLLIAGGLIFFLRKKK